MKKLLSIAFLALGISPAFADWTGKDASGATVTFSNPGTCTSVVCVPVAQLVNSSGTTLIGVAGTANAGVLSVQGIASMTPLFITSATAPVVTMNSASANSGVTAPVSAVFDDTSPTTITENNFGYLRMSANRNQYTTIRDAGGNERGVNVTAGNALTVDASATTQPISGTVTVQQSTSSNLKAQVDPLTAASWGIGTSTQNSSSATNGQLALAQFNTTPTTISTGNMSPLQMDNAGNLLVNIKAGAGSGGTALADNSAFTQSTTSETPVGCLYNTSYANATSGRSTIVRCAITGDVYTNLSMIAGAVPSATNPIWAAAAQATVSAGNSQNGVTANANGTSISVTGYGAALFNVNCSVNCTGGTTINFEALDVVGTAFAVAALPVTGASTAVTTVTNQSGAAQFCVPNMGYTSMRGRVSAYSAGTITVTITPINANSCDLTQVVNTNANGSATSANSSPVVIASDQAAVAVKAASGAIASGAVASGAIASGAYASGAVSSGAYASGSLASGAVVDITNMSASTGAAAPSKAIYTGTLQSGATGGFIKGNITCDNHVFKHITSATDTVAVQGVASQTIYICSWRSRAAGVATWFLENTASANNNCSSTLTQITGVATEAANTGETWGSAFWSGLKNTSGNGLCINSTGTGGVDVDIWYTQF